jgi:hypothetical protein
MSPSKDGDRPARATPDRPGNASANGEGVLSKLPRTRPQRSSPRRTAARAASAAAAAPVTGVAPAASTAPARSHGRSSSPRAKSATARSPKKPAGARDARTRTARPAAARVSIEPAPRQGFESETERANGTVQPPGGADLVASAAEIFGEFAKAGVAKGERLLKDLLSHLPLS